MSPYPHLAQQPDPLRLVVIGNGMAATALAEALTDAPNRPASVTIIGDEPHGGYNRILLSSVLAGDKDLAEIITHPADWYEERGITLLTGDPVETIDRAARSLTTRSGRVIPWTRLVLATGAEPVRLPIPGVDLPGVLGFRSIADVEAMLDATASKKRAVVVGGGILGLEAAWGLRRQGMSVQVVHMTDSLMERQLDPVAAGMLRTDLEARGIAFVTGSTAAAIEGQDRVEGVRLADGRLLPADLVVLAAGIRPRTDLARQAGLAVGRGILVQDDMRCSDPNIFAIGECVEHAGECYGLVLPVRDMARVCAHHLAEDQPALTFRRPNMSAKLKIPGIDLFSAGLTGAANNDDHELVYRSPDAKIYKKLVLRQGRIVGAMLYGDVKDSAQLWQWMVDRVDITPRCPQTPCPGCPSKGWIEMPASLDPALLPDEAVVCHCAGITKGTIIAVAQAEGLTSLEQLRARTGTGSGCGQCMALAAAVLALALSPEQAARLQAEQEGSLRQARRQSFGFRWWHRTNAVTMTLLLLTGLALHFPGFASFEWAYRIHEWSGLGTIAAYLVFLGLSWGFQRRWKRDLDGLTMFALMPLILLTGLAFLWPALLPEKLFSLSGITPVALGHLLLAVLSVAFLMQHLTTAPFRWWRKRALRR